LQSQTLCDVIYDQSEFDLRCEWGEQGVAQLASISDVVAIVDVLSFSTCVEIATNNGAMIFPYQWKDESALDYATSVDAELASVKRTFSDGYSLSPCSLIDIPAGTKLVLPSPNGSALSLLTRQTPTLAGCLRNCEAIAHFAQSYGTKIAVIPAGEKWENRGLRPALEDLIGAGAILSYLNGSLSPEADAAVVTFHSFKDTLVSVLSRCSSGKELIARGFAQDIELAAALNTSSCVPLLTHNAYVKQ
jgi:2-phosphosulfolactate phosphatase